MPSILRSLTLIAATAALPAALHAQYTPQSNVQWGLTASGSSHHRKILQVVTLSQPGVRHSCHLRSLTDDAITCRPNLSHKTTTYQRDDVAAVIDPPDHSDRNTMLIPLALTAASLAGSFFVPLGWAITLRIFSGLFLCADGAMGIGAAGDHDNDVLLYQRPNTPLTVTLRTP